ncbi:uncharacterized protein LOC127799331 isoform X2 [Diospyros lotus]|uniref:uncharacterized protein LOC127799331 isoform X2 n=1 Tax=Diospyros lotus TaxID=55363 RepID=UPI002251F120|nr:uncharacterized protein LOC127799331 isoform X2 [Diospyros lotus]XP_052189231.1 uncharacterized protein LOC127799331 isoform X2 [Diospyros lotus]
MASSRFFFFGSYSITFRSSFSLLVSTFNQTMATSAALATTLRSLFCVLGGVMAATLIYTVSVDGSPFRVDLLNPWMVATLIDFYINVVALGAWVSYKESSWFSSSLWIVLLICFGSITTCCYIVFQFLKLSAEESVQDPIYYVLMRHSNKDGTENKRQFSVVTTKIFFSILGFLMLSTLIYTLLTDGSPFRKDLLTPWMTATLIDFYINLVPLSVWVAYKESSWTSAFSWIILLICFGSITTCTYIVRQLVYLPSQGPVHLILLNSSNRQV